jgi:lincosamide and streptogramin A transport system ATP-binding/permease protein
MTRIIIKDNIAPYSFWQEQMNILLQSSNEDSLISFSEYHDLFMENNGYEIDEIIEKESVKIGLDEEILNRPFNTLSGGEKTRALILPLFLKKDCFPLLDEPTDHLDIEGRELLADFLSKSKKGFILASHDRFLLDQCADHLVSINKNDVSLMQGNYSTWKYQFDIREEFEQRKAANLQREINALEKSAGQRRKWSTVKEKEKTGEFDSGFISHKASKLMKRAVSIEKRIEKNINSKKELLKNKESVYNLKMNSPGKSPERIVSINNLSVKIDDRKIISDLYLNVCKGERLAITGKNGSGKTTLLNAIDGSIPISEGEIIIPRNISISRAYQVPKWNEGFLKDYLIEEKIDITNFRFIMSAFGMTGEIFDHPLQSFSKGQLRKIDLCRTIFNSPNLLIWDEPLNYLDISSREQLEEFVLDQKPTIIFVEHDWFFIESVSTSIIQLKISARGGSAFG